MGVWSFKRRRRRRRRDQPTASGGSSCNGERSAFNIADSNRDGGECGGGDNRVGRTATRGLALPPLLRWRSTLALLITALIMAVTCLAPVSAATYEYNTWSASTQYGDRELFGSAVATASTNPAVPNGVYMVGGASNSIASTEYNDVWHSPDGVVWTFKATIPVYRVTPAVFITQNNALLIVGGRNSIYSSVDTYMESYKYNGTWYHASNICNGDPGTSAAGYVAVSPTTLFMFSGYTGSMTVSPFAYISFDAGRNWTARNVGPYPRVFTMCVYNAPNIICMGGYDAGGTSRNYITYTANNGLTFTTVTTGMGWTGRIQSGVVLWNGAIYLAGGRDGSTFHDDVWRTTSLTGTTGWNKITNNAPWSARTMHAHVVPPAVGDYVILMPGWDGVSGYTYVRDVWRYSSDECESTPCGAGATCQQRDASYTCLCPPGKFGVQCQTSINECASLPCANGGTCTSNVGNFTCACRPGFSGRMCQTNINECASQPCRNAGTCNDAVASFTCTCAPGYSGLLCQTNVNECSSAPCLNAGTCADGVAKYTCTCAGGYSGLTCETNIDECTSSPCLNSGTCTDAVNQYTCSCPPGYSGVRCQTNINECASSPCLNAGTCVDGVDSFTCSCNALWTGVRCDFSTNACASAPCQNGASCEDYGLAIGFSCTCMAGYTGVLCTTDINECDSSPCVNGTCVDAVNGFSCVCSAGYSGLTCETDINECASQPCANGGTCTDAVNGYTCTCGGGYSGVVCRTDLNECASSPCVNGGTCVDRSNHYTCLCAGGFSGHDCETDIDECTSSPCVNGGTCTDTVNGYVCACVSGYTGATCQSWVSTCASGPCANGGTCVMGFLSFACVCAPGFVGKYCETDFDECTSLPCRNGGDCHDGVNSFTCACAPGYSGVDCSTNINECASSPCLSGGTCIDGIDSFACNCASGYFGPTCSAGDGLCTADACTNGGQCVLGVNSFQCLCPFGFSGLFCEIFPAPTAVFTAPATIGPCGTFELDGTTSITPIGLPLKYFWSLNDAPMNDRIRPFPVAGPPPVMPSPSLGQFGSADGRIVIIDSAIDLAPAARSYNFSLSVQFTTPSGVHAYSQLTFRIVSKSVTTIPSVYVPFPHVFRRSTDHVIAPTIVPSTCAPAGATYSYLWTFIPSLTNPNVGLTARDLFVPAQTFVVGTTYTVSLRVGMHTPPHGNSPAVEYIAIVTPEGIETAAAPLVVAIAGGARSISVDQYLTIDGSASYDPDIGLPSADGRSSAGLTYEWSILNGTDGMPPPAPLNALAPVTWNHAVLTLPPYSLHADQTYVFQLTVAPRTAREVRSTLVFVVVTPVPAWPNPYVSIAGAGSIKLNPDAVLRLSGVVSSAITPPPPYRYVWTELSSHHLALDDPSIIAVTPNSPNLVLQSSALLPDHVYVFRLTVTDLSRPASILTGGVAYSQVAVSVNSPPIGGSCTATGVPGTVNTYELSCSGWHSPITPMRYQWGWIPVAPAVIDNFVVVTPDTQTITLLSDAQFASSIIRELPFGTVDVISYIADADGARAATVPMRVFTAVPTPALDDPSAYVRNLTSQLDQAMADQDTTHALSLIGVINSLLNANTSVNPEAREIRTKIVRTLLQVSLRVTTSSGLSTVIALLGGATFEPKELDDETSLLAIAVLNDLLARQNEWSRVATTVTQSTGSSGSLPSDNGIDSSITDNVAASAALSASNFLSSPNCSQSLSAVQELMRRILSLCTSDALPGERASTIDTAQIRAIVQRTFESGLQLNYSGSSSSFVLPDLAYLSSSPYDVSVVTYSNISACLARLTGANTGVAGAGGGMLTHQTVADQCLPTGDIIPGDDSSSAGAGSGAGGVLVSDLTTAEVIDRNGTVHSVSGLPPSRAINFTIPVTGVPGTGARIRCVWWNTNSLKWDTSGCRTTYDVVAQPDVVYCSCTHLTDFAVLLNEDRVRAGDCVPRLTQSVSYQLFAAFYALLVLIATHRFGCTIYMYGWAGKPLAVLSHALVLAVTITRFGVMMTYISAIDLSFRTVAVLAAVPYILEIPLLTFVIFAWSGIYALHNRSRARGSSPQNSEFAPAKQLKGPAVAGLNRSTSVSSNWSDARSSLPSNQPPALRKAMSSSASSASAAVNPLLKYRVLFIAANVFVVIVAVTLFAIIAANPSPTADETAAAQVTGAANDDADLLVVSSDSDLETSSNNTMLLRVSTFGSVLIGTIAIGLSFGFIIFGVRLSRQLSSHRHARKLFRIACVCSLAFLCESILVLFSVVQSHTFVVWFALLNGFYLAADWCALAAILHLFYADDKHANSVYKNGDSATPPDGLSATAAIAVARARMAAGSHGNGGAGISPQNSQIPLVRALSNEQRISGVASGGLAAPISIEIRNSNTAITPLTGRSSEVELHSPPNVVPQPVASLTPLAASASAISDAAFGVENGAGAGAAGAPHVTVDIPQSGSPPATAALVLSPTDVQFPLLASPTAAVGATTSTTAAVTVNGKTTSPRSVTHHPQSRNSGVITAPPLLPPPKLSLSGKRSSRKQLLAPLNTNGSPTAGAASGTASTTAAGEVASPINRNFLSTLDADRLVKEKKRKAKIAERARKQLALARLRADREARARANGGAVPPDSHSLSAGSGSGSSGGSDGSGSDGSQSETGGPAPGSGSAHASADAEPPSPPAVVDATVAAALAAVTKATTPAAVSSPTGSSIVAEKRGWLGSLPPPAKRPASPSSAAAVSAAFAAAAAAAATSATTTAAPAPTGGFTVSVSDCASVTAPAAPVVVVRPVIDTSLSAVECDDGDSDAATVVVDARVDIDGEPNSIVVADVMTAANSPPLEPAVPSTAPSDSPTGQSATAATPFVITSTAPAKTGARPIGLSPLVLRKLGRNLYL